jgi:hypothetical protein
MNTALEYSTRVVQEGGLRCKKSTLNDLVHLTPLRIPLNPPQLLLTVDGDPECLSGRMAHAVVCCTDVLAAVVTAHVLL